MKALAIALLFFPIGAPAGVADSAAGGFTIKFTLAIQAPPADVYRKFVGIAEWWDSAHTYSGNARNLSIELKPGGCFCEKLPNGGVQHMVVVRYDTGRTLVLTGGLGPLQSAAAAGAMTVEIAPTQSGSKFDFTYAVTGYAAGGLAAWAPQVDSVLEQQLARLKRFVETGRPEARN